MSPVDKLLECLHFGTNFAFSTEGQEFFAPKEYSNEPKHFPCCLQAKRAQHNSSFGDSSSPGFSRQMFPVVCAECGKDTQVPFEPRGDKPVYCSDCYRKGRTSR